MKIIKIGVQEFAQPSPRKGSIEPSSGFSTPLKKGIELHQRLQDEKKSEFPEYLSEVPVRAVFRKGDFVFEVSGRMDGFLPGPRPKIDEIKSSFNIFDLARTIKERRFDHPYFLQLVSYGYFYKKEHGIKPELVFELISSRRREGHAFEVYWDEREYETWLERRLEELEQEAIKAERRLNRRKKLSEIIPFPFSEPRKGQRELMEFIEHGMKLEKKILIQAPTGLGKTIGVLHPTLREALGRGQRVIYLTPKNSQQVVAEEAVEKFQEKGCSLRALTITAKSKLCLKAEPLCNPEYCEFAKDYYTKVSTFGLRDELAKKKKLTSRVMKNLARKYEVCPFELQLEAVNEADLIICDYNYVFGHDSVLGKISTSGFAQDGLPNLVIDEAHNLPARTMGNFSPKISTTFLEALRKDMMTLPKRFRNDFEELLETCIFTLQDLTPPHEASDILQLDPEVFSFVNEELKKFLSMYLDSEVEIKPRDVVLRLVFYWGDFTEVLSTIHPDQKQFFVSGYNDGQGRSIKITCCDASDLIRDRYQRFAHHVLFSATLKPFSYYLKLSGLDAEELIQEEFSSPFKKENRKVLIIPQVSTKFSGRQQNYPKIAEAMERIIGLKKGNYLAFFPSFDFLEQVLKFFRAPSGVRVLKQGRFTTGEEVESTLELLRSKTAPIFLFAVQGGVYSEGIDYAGEMVIGAFVIGPPLPGFDFEREKMKEYYEREYGQGFDYAYTYPAMAKAVQAAGRVIRTETDHGLIILMDNRFLNPSYHQSLPQDWFDSTPQELVSTSILKDVDEFWNVPNDG